MEAPTCRCTGGIGYKLLFRVIRKYAAAIRYLQPSDSLPSAAAIGYFNSESSVEAGRPSSGPAEPTTRDRSRCRLARRACRSRARAQPSSPHAPAIKQP
jgi:hypothetical protein